MPLPENATLFGLPVANVAVLLELHLMNTLDLVSHNQWPAKLSLLTGFPACSQSPWLWITQEVLKDFSGPLEPLRQKQVGQRDCTQVKKDFLLAGWSGTGDLIVHKGV